MRYVLQPDGSLRDADGKRFDGPEVSDREVAVPHLRPHVVPFAMPKGDIFGIRVTYSSHCWTKRFDPMAHDPIPLIFRDGRKPRVFSRTRYEHSAALADMLANLATMRLFWTPSDRNFSVHDATSVVGGVAHTAFFTLSKDRGRLGGVRYHLVMSVESAYPAPQPSPGRKLTAAAAVDAAMNGMRLAYRR